MKPRASNPFRPHLATLAALLAAPLAHAASGTWLGTSGDWGVAGTWSGGTIADAIDSTANFTGVNITADQIINLDAARTIGNITFTDLTTASHNLTISGANILTLDRTAGAPIIDVTQTGRTLTISSQISGGDGLQKNGAGSLNLSGNNNYTGITAISVGTVAISHNSALGSSAAGSNQTTIAATGNNTAGGILSLSGNITSAENISISGNTEQNSYSAALQNTSDTNILNGNITLTGTTLRLAAYGGALTFGGTITRTSGASTLALQAGSGAAITVNNTINNNNGLLNILGFAGGAPSNGVTLKGAATNNSATNVMENGLLILGVTNALKTTASLQIGTTGSNTGFDVGKFDLAGFNQTIGGFAGAKNTGGTIAPDSSRIVTNSVTGTSLLTVGNGNASATFNGVILDGGAGKIVALTKIGTGTQTLVGNSDYSGVTTISAGTLAITHSNALGSNVGNTTIAALGNTNGGILNLSGNINSPENITITGATEQNSFMSAILNTGGTNTLSGNITLASPSGGIRLGTSGSSGSLTFSGNISQTGTSQGLTFSANGGTTITVNNPIANNGGPLAVYSAGSVTLKGVNGAGGIGDTAIAQGGTIKLGVSDALNTTANLTIGTAVGQQVGTFDLAGFNQTVNALNGVADGLNTQRKVTNSAAGSGTNTLTVGNNNGTGVFNGVLQDGATAKVALTKTGSGNQTLNGTNTHTGGTLVSGGTLTLGNTTDTLANGGAVNVNGGTLAVGTNTDTVGAVTLTSGSITGTGAGTLTGASYDVRSGSASAILAGSGVVLTKTTGGTVTLSGVNTYTGATTITTGTLQLDGSTHASSAVDIGTAGTLSGSGTVNGNATLTGGGIINKSAGTIAGTLAVTGGNWNGAGTVTGAVSSSSGTFTIASGANLTATAGVSATGGSVVVNGTLTGTLLANSSTTLSGTGTVTGNTTIQGIHNPGNSPGIQNFGGNLDYTGGASVVNWELSGNTSTNAANPNAIFDQLLVGGNLDFTDLTSINLAFNASGNVLWANTFWDTAQSWTLYDVTGTTTNFGNLSLTTINWLDSGSNAFNTARSGNSFSLTQTGQDVILNYNVVPEPRAALLGALGLLALLRRRR